MHDCTRSGQNHSHVQYTFNCACVHIHACYILSKSCSVECKQLFPAGHKQNKNVTLKKEDIDKLGETIERGGCCSSRFNQFIRHCRMVNLDPEKVYLVFSK